MVQYFDSWKAVEKAITAAKTTTELKKIATDLEQRRAPHDWITAAYNAYLDKL